MARNFLRFWLPFGLLLLAPALIFESAEWHAYGTLTTKYLWGNYLFLAAPHWLVAALAIFYSNARRLALLLILLVLNLLAAAVLWHAVQSSDAGIWLMYLPMAALTLLFCLAAWMAWMHVKK